MRAFAVFLADICAVAAAWVVAFLLRFNFELPDEFMPGNLLAMAIGVPVSALCFRVFGLYRGIWVFASLPDLMRIARAVALTPVMESVILKAIEKDPARRFQSAAEFRTALLKLGLVKRRQRERGDGQTPERIAYRRTPSPLMRGLWFDAALVAAFVALIYTLGIYPVGSDVDSANFTPAAQNADADLKPTVATRRTSVSTTKNTVPKERRPEASYDVLRDAWGD
jgi:hypothetical protein